MSTGVTTPGSSSGQSQDRPRGVVASTHRSDGRHVSHDVGTSREQGTPRVREREQGVFNIPALFRGYRRAHGVNSFAAAVERTRHDTSSKHTPAIGTMVSLWSYPQITVHSVMSTYVP